jgi:calcium-dependent protein kinase
MKERHIN